MLQRIQSVFLLVVALFALLFPFLPLGSLSVNQVSENISLLDAHVSPDVLIKGDLALFWWPLILLPVVIIILSVYTIFQFKRRMYQVKLGKLNMLAHMVMLILSFLFIDGLKETYANNDFSYGLAIFMPVVSLLFILRANRSIIKDEGLVRAADRIR
jgi:uncharacterized membrane protein